jgi:transcriptional regulator with XRE-family HTH domain
MNFAKNLRVEMAKTNISRKDLADLTGISKSAISKYRSGKALPGVRILHKLRVALDCKASDLI